MTDGYCIKRVTYKGRRITPAAPDCAMRGQIGGSVVRGGIF